MGRSLGTQRQKGHTGEMQSGGDPPSVAALKVRDGATGQGMWRPPEARKGRLYICFQTCFC